MDCNKIACRDRWGRSWASEAGQREDLSRYHSEAGREQLGGSDGESLGQSLLLFEEPGLRVLLSLEILAK